MRAPIGSLLVKNTKRRRGTPRKEFPEYLAKIRQCGCLACGRVPSEAAHVRMSDARYNKVNPGIGSKPHDSYCVPLCPSHHRTGPDAQHSQSERQFWDKLKIDPLAVALKLWASQKVEEMQIICSEARHGKV